MFQQAGPLCALGCVSFCSQVFLLHAVGLLGFFDHPWSLGLSVIYIMLVQAIAGAAKDLTKMNAKSSVKVPLLHNSQQGGFFIGAE